MRKSLRRAIEKREQALGIKRRPWLLCATCGDVIAPSQDAHKRLDAFAGKERFFPDGLWCHKDCKQGTLRWYRHLGRPVAGFEDLYNEERDQQFLRWYVHLIEEEMPVKIVTAVCDNCHVTGLQADETKKCERCGRLACAHRYRDGMCAPCWVAARAGSDDAPGVVSETPGRAPAPPVEWTTRSTPKTTNKVARSKAPSNAISAALNGKTTAQLTAIAEANGVGDKWAAWMKKFATNMGMARMQLNGALRRIENPVLEPSAKGTETGRIKTTKPNTKEVKKKVKK